MFSRFGRIFSIQVSASKQSKYNQYWIAVLRTTKANPVELTTEEMHVNHGYIVSKASVNRLRRAQDRLMEGNRQENQECAVTLQRLERDNQWNSLKRG